MADNKDKKALNVPDKRNVPAIRFVEYREDYARTTLGKIGNTYNGLTGKSAEDFGQGSPYITYKSIFDNSRVDISRVEYVQISDIEQRNKKQNKVARGDIFFTTSSETPEEVGMTSVLLDNIADCYLNSFCFGYRVYSQEQYLPEYLRFYLRSSIIRKKLFVLAQGSTRFNLSKNEVMRIGINMPKAIEQRKIARFLSLLEERITTQNKIIEDLKKLKSAIVDKLYSSTNGETYSFRQLFEIVNEKNKKLTYSNVLSASQELGMIERSDINIEIKFEQDSISGYKIVRKGDYVVHLRSFQGGFAFSDRTGICSPAYTILRPNNLVAYGYLSHFFTSKPFIKSLKLVTYGIRDGRTINVDEWLDMTIILPTRQKQLHIISVINSIDNKLSNENQIHNYLLRQRVYLLKAMFI